MHLAHHPGTNYRLWAHTFFDGRFPGFLPAVDLQAHEEQKAALRRAFTRATSLKTLVGRPILTECLEPQHP